MKKILNIATALLTALTLNAQSQQFNTRIIPTPQHAVKTQGEMMISDSWDFDDENIIEIPYSKDSVKVLKSIAKIHKQAPGHPLVIIRQTASIPGAKHQDQAYRLVVTPNEFQIYYVDTPGLKNASYTMAFLRINWNGTIPCMEITDYPAYEYRGWLDDVSRGPVTNVSFMSRQQQYLGSLKMNFGSYYTEHTLYNEKYPDIIPANSLNIGIQRDEDNDLEMMANLQCFAHFEKTLRIPFYQYMMDTKYNLDPSNPLSYDFLADQIANTVKHYPDSRFFNINCDETESLGAGRARDYVNQVGASDAYCRHINKVFDLIKPYNKEVLMWGDIVGNDPEMLKKLPKEMQYIVWSYVAQENYNSMLEPFKKLHEEQGTQFWVAPGVSHWSSIPQVHNYIKNIANLSRDGYLSGARGLINTAWDDSGESLFGDCWHAMAWSAEMAWNPIKSTDPEAAKTELAERERLFNENYSRQENINTDKIYSVGTLSSNKWVRDWFNTGALRQSLIEFYPSNVGDDMLTRCDSVDQLVAPLAEQLTEEGLEHFAYAAHRILAVSMKSRLRVHLYKALNDPSQANLQTAKELSQRYFKAIHELEKEYLLLWDDESDQYSRDIITDRYNQLGNEVLEAFNHVFISTDAAADGSVMVTLRTIGNDLPIYYTIDGRRPSNGSLIYTQPFKLERSALVKALTIDQWGTRFDTEKYLLKHKGMGHLTSLGSPYSTYKATYSGGGDNALADGEMGSDLSYSDGHWQGYWGQDMIANYDFGKKTSINQINIRFCQNTFDWILSPKELEIFTSLDGKNWTLVRAEHLNPDFRIGGTRIQDEVVRNLKLNTQYLRVVAKNPGKLPEWHPAPNYESYFFVDEIVIE